jgi:ZIP family zinc transporter
MGMLIAGAIGLHNFSEGLAIGVSRVPVRSAGDHPDRRLRHPQRHRGFGIVGPLNGIIPSWKWIGLAGLIGGSPTFVGTLVGYRGVVAPSDLLLHACRRRHLYVVGQLWTTAQRPTDLILAALVIGYLIGLSSGLIITYGGG